MKRLIAAIAAAALLSTGLLVAAPSASAAPLDVTPIGFVGGPGHAGLYGWGAATTQNGNVLIGDYWNRRVVEYTRSGNFVRTFVQNIGWAEQQHQSPYGLARDPRDGAIYFADTDRRRVIKYSASGDFLFKVGVNNTTASGPGVFRYPSRVAVHSDGRFFVVDTWDHSIVAHTETGTELYQFGSWGPALGQIKSPHGADFDSTDRLFVTDPGNARVQVFSVGSTTAQPLFAFGSKGSAPGQFAGDMRGLCIDKAHDWVYVVDGAGNRVSKFDGQGNYLLRWGSQGTGDGQFSDGGRECAVDADGNVWVGDMPNFRAQKFSPTGAFLMAVPNPPEPPPVGGFNGPRGVAVDGSGNVWVGDTYNWRLQKFAADGSVLFAIGSRGRGDYKFNYTRNVAVDPRNNDFLVTDTDNHQIKRYDSDGTHIWTIGSSGLGPDLFRNPQGIDVNGDGQIVVVDTHNDRVVILNPDGSYVRTIGSRGTGAGQFTFPRGAAWAPDGTIWVTDSGRDDIQHFSATGTYLGQVGKGTLGDPFDVEVTDDYVIVADTSSHVIRVFGTDGTAIGEFGGYGRGAGKLIAPLGLELQGNVLYVAERENDRIQKFRLNFITGTPPPPPPPSDEVPPTAAVAVPSQDEVFAALPVVLSGTASDNVGVERVTVAIRDQETNLWLQADGTYGPWDTRLRDATLADLGTTSTGWSYTFDPGRDGRFGLQILAWDAAGNVSPQQWRGFEITATPPPPSDDTEDPALTYASPTQDEAVPALPVTLSGTASDNVGVTGVQITVQDKVTKQWLQADGNWGPWATRQCEAVLGTPGGAETTWSFSFDTPGSGTYTSSATAFDDAGNASGTAWRRFNVG